MREAAHSKLSGYLIALLLFALALWLTLLVVSLMEQATLLLFLGAIVISSRLGARGPGVLITLLSILACAYLFLIPQSPNTAAAGMSTGSARGDTAALIVFVVVAALINWMNIARERAEAATRAAESKYHDTFEYAITGIYQTTLDGRYTMANPMLARMFGYDSPEMMIESVRDENNLERRFYVEAGRRAEFARLVREHGVVTGFESEIYRADNSRIWISEHALAIRDGKNNLVGFQGTTIEITDRKRAEAALKRAYDELEMRVTERTAELASSNEALRASHEQLRALSAHLQSIREEERTYIAREIHDELGQTLTALMMDLAWVEDRLGKSNEAGVRRVLIEKTASMMKLVGTTMDTVRKIAAELRPGVLDELGLKAAIEWQAGEFERRTSIMCRLQSDLEEVDVTRESATAFFRILQESLTNIARHAHATIVNLTLTEHDGDLVLRIDDDGRGITPTSLADTRSLGLLGMRERAGQLGGEVTITGAAGQGTGVSVRMPMFQAHRAANSEEASELARLQKDEKNDD